MSHTTGHWSIHAPAGSDTYLVAAGSQIVFAITKGTIPTREDARLIAAAPELLAMLQRLTHPAADDDDLADALDLIRRVTGEA